MNGEACPVQHRPRDHENEARKGNLKGERDGGRDLGEDHPTVGGGDGGPVPFEPRSQDKGLYHGWDRGNGRKRERTRKSHNFSRNRNRRSGGGDTLGLTRKRKCGPVRSSGFEWSPNWRLSGTSNRGLGRGRNQNRGKCQSWG